LILHMPDSWKVCDDIFLLECGRIMDHGNYDYLSTQSKFEMAKG
jgi:hypothetical protein